MQINALFATVLGLTLIAAPAARAERADRNQPMVVESDGGSKAATVDLTRRITTLSGHVVISQGTLQIRAEKVEIHEDSPGRFQATALGSAAQPATFHQKRDRVDEVIEAQALRVDYDGTNDRIRFSGDARMQVLRAGVVADEARAASIVYDQPTDTITFDGGAAPTPGAAPGRARLVFVPRAADAPASAPLPPTPPSSAGAGR